MTYVPEAAQAAVMTAGAVTGGSMVAAAPLVSAARAEKMERTNKKLTEQIKRMTRPKSITIKPGETKSMFLFVRHRHYKRRISFPLVNKEKKEDKLSFDVACQPI
jgi:hypothetical protein